jgi:YHS domain-containing protein
MNVDSNDVILKGYDPVAYFTHHQAVKGNPAIQIRFAGAIYYFVSLADKAAFSKNPSGYVPQYGAFCAYHLGKGELKTAIQRTFSSIRANSMFVPPPIIRKNFAGISTKKYKRPTRTGFP